MPELLPVTLAARGPARIRPDLERLRSALESLGGPASGLRSVLMVGTNGKGSTATLLEAILRAHGLRTGLYTSPHLVRVEERIRIDGEPLPGAELVRLLERLEPFPDLTFFETLTAAALISFVEHRVDVAVLEAGMGGTWDATRVASSSIAGLTNVGTDHRRWLGADPAEIAADKGRALAAAEIAVLGSGVAEGLIGSLAAPRARRAASSVRLSAAADGRLRLGWGADRTELRLPFAGVHQRANLELAVALAVAATERGWLPRLEPAAVAAAVESAVWPGRLTEHRISGRRVLVDGAHNLEAAVALADHLRASCERPNLLFSCLEDKPLEAMAGVLAPVVADVVVCGLDDQRVMPADRLRAAFGGVGWAPDPIAALAQLPDPVVAAGSLRLAGALIAEEGA